MDEGRERLASEFPRGPSEVLLEGGVDADVPPLDARDAEHVERQLEEPLEVQWRHAHPPGSRGLRRGYCTGPIRCQVPRPPSLGLKFTSLARMYSPSREAQT